MSKKVFCIIGFLFLTLSGKSQIELNGMTGLNSTLLKTSGFDWNSSSSIGYQAGVSVTVGKYFYIEPGIFYVSNNAYLNTVENGSNDEITYEYHTSSIRIPALGGYHLIGNAENSFYDIRVFAGPSISFLLSAEQPAGLNTSQFSKVNWGLNAGVGFSVWIFHCNLGYDRGLNKIYNSVQSDNIKSDMFWANIGVRYRF